MPIDVNRLLTTCERALSLDERANKYDPVDGLDCLTNALMAVKSDITTITYSQTFAVQTDEQNVFELPSQLIRLVSLTYPSTWKTTLQQVTRQFMDEAQAKKIVEAAALSILQARRGSAETTPPEAVML